jgi:hypothetical protein
MSDSPLVGMNRDALHDQLELAPLSRRHSVPRLSAILEAWGQLTPAPGSSSVGRLTFTPCSERGPLLHLARASTYTRALR